MSEHPTVAFLLAAHERAEALAQAASGHNWLTAPGDRPGDSWLIDETMHLAEVETPTAEHVVLHDPAAVLRRVAAERELLAEHQPTREAWGDRLDDPCELRGCSCKSGDYVPACGTCATGHPRDAVLQHYPCRTALLLAKGWGWTDDHAKEL